MNINPALECLCLRIGVFSGSCFYSLRVISIDLDLDWKELIPCSGSLGEVSIFLRQTVVIPVLILVGPQQAHQHSDTIQRARSEY